MAYQIDQMINKFAGLQSNFKDDKVEARNNGGSASQQHAGEGDNDLAFAVVMARYIANQFRYPIFETPLPV